MDWKQERRDGKIKSLGGRAFGSLEGPGPCWETSGSAARENLWISGRGKPLDHQSQMEDIPRRGLPRRVFPWGIFPWPRWVNAGVVRGASTPHNSRHCAREASLGTGKELCAAAGAAALLRRLLQEFCGSQRILGSFNSSLSPGQGSPPPSAPQLFGISGMSFSSVRSGEESVDSQGIGMDSAPTDRAVPRVRSWEHPESRETSGVWGQVSVVPQGGDLGFRVQMLRFKSDLSSANVWDLS